MNAPAEEPLLTYEEFVRLHGDEALVDLVNGRVVRYQPYTLRGFVTGNAIGLITEFVRATDLGRCFAGDTFIRTKIDPPCCRGADFCFVSYAKMPKEQRIPAGPLVIAPELVVEVRSPSDRIAEVNEKAEEYLAAGVTVVVVLDPETESLAVHHKNEVPVRMHNGDELTLPDVLPGFTAEVSKFFR